MKGGKRGQASRTWDRHRRDLARPVAATLKECATWLGVTEDRLRPVAEQVEPYRHADGSPRWSLFLLERALWPERFHKDQPGSVTRRRATG